MTDIATRRALAGISHLAEKAATTHDPKKAAQDLDDVRGEMRRFLTATSDDAKLALAQVAHAFPEFPLSEDDTAILVDTADPTAPDGYGRTYYLTLTEIPR